MELLHVCFSFLCRKTRTNLEGKHMLVLCILYRGERRDILTGLYCHKAEWNAKTLGLHRLNKTCGAVMTTLILFSVKRMKCSNS